MSASQVIVLVVASTVVIAGMVVIVIREISAEPWRSRLPRTRQIAEAVVPLVGAVVLLGALWAAVR